MAILSTLLKIENGRFVGVPRERGREELSRNDLMVACIPDDIDWIVSNPRMV